MKPRIAHEVVKLSAPPVSVEVTAAGKLVPCSSCGRLRLNLPGPHAPHYARGHLVDCVGKAVGRG